jgi:hypothetical protein
MDYRGGEDQNVSMRKESRECLFSLGASFLGTGVIIIAQALKKDARSDSRKIYYKQKSPHQQTLLSS